MPNKNSNERCLCFAIETGVGEWKLALGDGSNEREVTVPARDVHGLLREIQKSKVKFGLKAKVKVYSCYEAGRDGFWIHRMLTKHGVDNVVVDPASIEVNRRAKQRKTDRMDARKLRQMLLRYRLQEEKKLWSVLHVPSEEDEGKRRHHREVERLKKERGSHLCRLRSLLIVHGLNPSRLPRDAAPLRDWDNKPLPEVLVEEYRREWERLEMIDKQIANMKVIRREKMKEKEASRSIRIAQKLALARGLGEETAWTLSHEFFGWRTFKNRREVGSSAGLTGCPYASGNMRKELGISKAGNARIRTLMVELAWRWLQFQPKSALAQWYEQRYAHGGARMRRIGIVALARKLLVALWKYIEQDTVPEGAVLRAA